MGSFAAALGGVNTPETQQADDDYSVGRLVEAVAHSRYAGEHVDHRDGRRLPGRSRPRRLASRHGLRVGPYVKQGAVVSTRYSQVNALRTIEDILGTQHINLNTAFQRPMADVFDIASSGSWTYTATASTVLKTTTLMLAQGEDRRALRGGRRGQAEAQRGLLGACDGRHGLLRRPTRSRPRASTACCGRG